MKKSIISLAIIFSWSVGFSQSATWLNKQPSVSANPQVSQQVSPQASASVPSVSGAQPTLPQQKGFFESSTFERTADKIFDTDKDSFDFENGTLNWKGKTFNVGDSRMVRARFERYLAMPSVSQDYNAYQAILAEITSRLSASNDRLPDEVVRACWSRLFDAAEYDVDGRSSLTIANLVYLSWRMRGEYQTARREEAKQQEITDEQKKEVIGKAEFGEYATDKIVSQNRKHNTKQRTKGTTALAYEVQNLETEIANLATKKGAKELVGTKAVLLFQSQIVSFLLERKFQQAQIASMFYRHIFRGSAQELQVGKDEIKELIPVSSFLPSIDIFENISTEARKDIRDGMVAVNTLIKNGEMFGAFERLMETFALGEFDSELALLPSEKRRQILKIYKDVSAMKTLADAKDWGAIIEILEDFKTTAPDFRTREVLAKVRTAQRVSDMHVMAAKQAAALGKIEDVKASLAQAMQMWPLNPAISEFNKDLVGLASGASKYIQKFDELLARKNYREIVAEAPEYAIAFRQDKERAEELRKIVVRISQIDTLIAQAEEFEKQNNKYFAWDILENARAIDGSDSKLALALARLAPEVSDYVKMLGRAKAEEEKQNYAIALNCYLSAQEIFPASQACRLGIERVASKYAE